MKCFNYRDVPVNEGLRARDLDGWIDYFNTVRELERIDPLLISPAIREAATGKDNRIHDFINAWDDSVVRNSYKSGVTSPRVYDQGGRHRELKLFRQALPDIATWMLFADNDLTNLIASSIDERGFRNPLELYLDPDSYGHAMTDLAWHYGDEPGLEFGCYLGSLLEPGATD